MTDNLKMKTQIKYILILLVIFLCGFNASAQWNAEKELEVTFSIPPIALLDIEPGINNAIYFSISPAIESGASPQIQDVSSETLWLNYSSALSAIHGSRKIVAQITGSDLPDGLKLNVEASSYRGSGKGNLGHSAGKITLSSQPQAIITDVGNCYTGDGKGNGHSLTFSIEVNDYSKITADDESAFTIVYTISDN